MSNFCVKCGKRLNESLETNRGVQVELRVLPNVGMPFVVFAGKVCDKCYELLAKLWECDNQ